MPTIGFIGAGNMATAIISGISRADLCEDILGYDIGAEKLEALKKYGVIPYSDVVSMTKAADYLVLAVKPQQMEEALTPLIGQIKPETVVISIAAGVTADYISNLLGYAAKVVLVMPNTPLMLSCGATAMSKTPYVSDSEFGFVRSVFECAGIVETIPNDKMNEVIPINGSSPAFIYEFAKYFSEYGKSVGLDEKASLRLFSQTLIGSAKMMTESGLTIDELITMVSSKGGTTIAGLAAMRENGLEKAVKAGCESCVVRAYELTK